MPQFLVMISLLAKQLAGGFLPGLRFPCPSLSSSVRFVMTLSIGAMLLAGCSGSGSDTDVVDFSSPAETELASTDQPDAVSNDGAAGVLADDDGVDAIAENSVIDLNNNIPAIEAQEEAPVDTDSDSIVDSPLETTNEIEVSDVIVTEPATGGVDPLVQNLISVIFDVTVPAYMSDALQVRLLWGDREISPRWVGDEFWSVTDDLPTDTEHRLVATFSDANGDLTLGSFETVFRTGINSSESFQITAEQFETDRWDSDGDGVSNLEESIAGTDVFNPPRILLFSETRDFRHDSTEVALTTLEELASSVGMLTDRANDSAGVFTDENLANYEAVVWVMTSGNVLDDGEQVAFEAFIRSGKGYAGIHAASFTEYEWPWYGSLVGAYFDRHPEIQSATQNVEDTSHPSTRHLDSTWTRTDEWYDYRSNPRAFVNVLLSLDESTYSGGGMGLDHPSAWYHEFEGGRAWYTGGGHTEASYAEENFRKHLLGGLRYAAGRDGEGITY